MVEDRPHIPPYEFRGFSHLRGRRSWTEGLQRLTSPHPACLSVSVLDVPVFGHRLMVMAALAQGLPVLFIPEQIRVAAMRLDMIHDGRRDEPSFLFASDAPGMTFQEKHPGFLPLSPVATQHGVFPFALALPFMFITILFSIRHQLWTSRISARCLRSSWHSYHLRYQKRTDGFKPRSFILFLLIIVYLTEASDIKCCLSDIQ